jgi:D-alanyl-D-alanine carboxypeptidase
MNTSIILLILVTATSVFSQPSVCRDDGTVSSHENLVNVSKEDEKLKRSFVPQNLKTVPQTLIKNASGMSERLRQDVLESLTQMITMAQGSGVVLKVYSGYRSYDQQCATYASKFDKFKSRFNSDAELLKYVQSISAVPGRSEHQLGTSVDLVYPSTGYKLVFPDIQNRCSGNMCREYKWLLDHAHKFGFALSYPRFGKEDLNPITQYSFEPWHWRFVGVEAAQEIHSLSSKLDRRISIIEYIKFKNKKLSLDQLKNPLKREPSSAGVQELVIGMGGDVSLSRPGSDRLDANGSTFNRFYTWEQMTEDLEKMTAGNDLNFMNLESVVSDQSLEVIAGKKYPQKSHPEGVKHLVNKVGFNLISTANNHAYDYSDAGILETLNHLDKIKSRSKVAISGLGTLKETLEPEIMDINGFKVAFIALGMKGDDRPDWESRWRPTPTKPGMLSVRHCADNTFEKAMSPCRQYGDLQKALENLKAAKADLRVVSIHEGMELSVYTKNGSKPDDDRSQTANGQQRQRSENRNIEAKFNLIKSYGVDLIVGHHSHNARPVEHNKNTLAFYGLGNLLFLGGKNYSTNSFPLWNQFGLFAKSYYSMIDGKAELSAVQIIYLKNNHIQPTFWDKEKASQFTDYLNQASFKSLGENGVKFKAKGDGSAVYCVEKIKKGKKAKALCP